jgi:transposase
MLCGPSCTSHRHEHPSKAESGEDVSNDRTQAINLIIEKTRRLAHGFRTFAHYRPRILLAASGTRIYRRRGHAHA